jgi:hypothetical protein
VEGLLKDKMIHFLRTALQMQGGFFITLSEYLFQLMEENPEVNT